MAALICLVGLQHRRIFRNQQSKYPSYGYIPFLFARFDFSCTFITKQYQFINNIKNAIQTILMGFRDTLNFWLYIPPFSLMVLFAFWRTFLFTNVISFLYYKNAIQSDSRNNRAISCGFFTSNVNHTKNFSKRYWHTMNIMLYWLL